ncbi:MAG: hypothetical protein AAGJ94_04420 [Pseudomonadota bacterium]
MGLVHHLAGGCFALAAAIVASNALAADTPSDPPQTCRELAGTATPAATTTNAGNQNARARRRAFRAMQVRYDNETINRNQRVTPAKIDRISRRLLPNQVLDGISRRKRVDLILANQSMFPQFYGTPGLLLNIILLSAKDYMFLDDGSLESLQLRPYGKIDDDGYRLNADMSGHIINTMCFELYDRRGEHKATYRYKVKLDVAKCGFKVIRRASDGSFPGTFLEADLRGTPARFKYKLQATALTQGSTKEFDGVTDCEPVDTSGQFLSVSEISFDNGDGTLRPLTRDVQHNHFFVMMASGCVDMFFEATPPLGTDLDTRDPNYCLGRCKRPLIVNTGA